MKNIHLYRQADNCSKMETGEDIFTEVLGNSPTIRVLSYLITGRNFDYSISDIAEGANVGWTTIHEVLPRLEKLGIVRQTRTIGMAKLYRINSANPFAVQLVALYEKLMMASIDKVIAKNRTKIRA